MDTATGTIGWIDMTVGDAEALRDFYAAVTGLVPRPVDMAGYADYEMTAPATGEAIAGICHARGENADLPPGWLVYFSVEHLDASIDAVRSGGGRVLVDPRGLAGGRFAVIEDPAGGVAALYEP